MSSFSQDTSYPTVAFTGSFREPFASRLILSRAETCPGSVTFAFAESCHIRPYFHHEHGGANRVNAGKV
jgi:hypothetical protein